MQAPMNSLSDSTPPRDRRAVVVGAGIAGLALAHGLARLGYGVRVLERDAVLRTEGAGLTLWPNALSALRSLGLGNVVEERTQVLNKAVTLTPAGATLTEVPLDRIEGRFGPFVSAHRADLLQGLLEHADVTVEFGAEVPLA
jgi:2-polyprenyl-6-methoxyphenol hydroxylase-like FAD-dependent oxidoreductase